jgi:hypothetical protein
MVVGNKKFGVVSHLVVGGSGVILPRKFFYFSTPMTAIPAFSETYFWALHYAVDRLNLQ